MLCFPAPISQRSIIPSTWMLKLTALHIKNLGTPLNSDPPCKPRRFLQYAYGSSDALSSAPIISLHSVRSQSRSCQTYSFALALRSSQKQTRPPLMYIRTVVSLGASLRFGLCARRAMVRSSSGFKVRVEVGVILCLTAGPNRRALGYCSSYRSIQSAANIKGEG